MAGVAAVAAPLKFVNRAMMVVPLVHGANKLVRWVSNFEGVMPFRDNETENPDINYRNIPVRGLYELRRLTAELEERLPEIDTDVLIVQGDGDPVVEPESATLLQELLVNARTRLRWIAADHHGIVLRNTGDTQGVLVRYLDELGAR